VSKGHVYTKTADNIYEWRIPARKEGRKEGKKGNERNTSCTYLKLNNMLGFGAQHVVHMIIDLYHREP
jgi:hypothetical protein